MTRISCEKRQEQRSKQKGMVIIMTQRKPELLAPAGDLERLLFAVDFGADAVYLGGKSFSMRAAVGFDAQSLQTGVAYAHAHGVRVYIALNTLPTNEEADALPGFIVQCAAAGVDAFILSDVGVLALCKQYAPDTELHISTQMGVTNYQTACALYELGASRVVLARELSLDDICTIRDKTPPQLEIEAFVHGAMCMSVSGRCLLSQYLTGRDANRGACAQPCRWSYRLVEETRPGQYFPVAQDEHGSYILNARDLCMIEHIDKLLDAGIDSFKIEGRAKSFYYTAAVTNAYRLAIDACLADRETYRADRWYAEEVRKVSHRDYNEGFYFGRPEQGQTTGSGGYIRTHDVVAYVEESDGNSAVLAQKNRFRDGDDTELVEPGKRPESFKIEGLCDMENAPLREAVHPMMRVRVKTPRRLPVRTILRRAVRNGEK
jgi:putative protease